MITAERLREVVDYDQETGIFKSKVFRNPCVPGKILGTKDPKGYLKIGIDYKTYAAHRLAWLYVFGEFPKHQIDHINGIRDDNRIANLRDVEPMLNTQNQRKAPKNNTTGYLGVSWSSQKNKFRVAIVSQCKQIHVGFFDDAKEASEAYLNAKEKLHIGYVK